jgi:uncharacterized protein YndB with AHSA1/START domain
VGESNNITPAGKSDSELVITRVFDAPRDLVWKAWTERMDQWSAPKGFTIPVSEGELKPGGSWKAVMRTPEGNELRLSGVYREIKKPERLVFTHAWDDDKGGRGPETLVTVVLNEQGDRTEMIFRQTGFQSRDSRDGHMGGWSESFDRLEDILASSESAVRT